MAIFWQFLAIIGSFITLTIKIIKSSNKQYFFDTNLRYLVIYGPSWAVPVFSLDSVLGPLYGGDGKSRTENEITESVHAEMCLK